MEDIDIIRGCLKQEEQAYKALVEKYSAYLFTICKRYVLDDAMAKDCLQESLIQIITKIDRYEERGKFKSWMGSVTVKKCLDIIRREKRFQFNEIDHDSGFSENEKVSYRLEISDVMDFLETIPDQYRIAINMFLVEGYAHKDIAEVLNVSVSTSRSLVSRGRKIIMKAFREELSNKNDGDKGEEDTGERFKLKILRS